MHMKLGMTMGSGGAFSPAKLPGLAAWYDPSDPAMFYQDAAMTTPVTADGDPVGAVVDKSGNGVHLTQATAGKRPLYRTSAGKHWLQFDGTDDVLSGTCPISAFPFEFLTSGDLSANAAGGHLSISESATVFHHLRSANGVTGQAQVRNSTAVTASLGGQTGGVIRGIFTSSEVTVDVNGNTDTDPHALTIGTPTAIFLGGALSTAIFFQGPIYQAVVISGLLTATEVSQLRAFMLAKT